MVTNSKNYAIILTCVSQCSQLAEQRIRNAQVKGSSPFIGSINRGVAQLGSAFGSGPKGRVFKSPRPDQNDMHNKPLQGTELCSGLFLLSIRVLFCFCRFS